MITFKSIYDVERNAIALMCFHDSFLKFYATIQSNAFILKHYTLDQILSFDDGDDDDYK